MPGGCAVLTCHGHSQSICICRRVASRRSASTSVDKCEHTDRRTCVRLIIVSNTPTLALIDGLIWNVANRYPVELMHPLFENQSNHQLESFSDFLVPLPPPSRVKSFMNEPDRKRESGKHAEIVL